MSQEDKTPKVASSAPGDSTKSSSEAQKSIVRGLVSKKKRRYQEDGFDLDLTYITQKMIAMGYPAEGMEGQYRNPMPEVQRFFELYHKDHYRIFNLCSERSYDVSKFHDRVACYPFDDHNCPPVSMLVDFCKDVDSWLAEHPDNVAAVHCKAGKGRTGVMIVAYLLWSKEWDNAVDAMSFYGVCRTEDGKGLTIPSQRRWMVYFDKYLHEAPPRPLDLQRALMVVRISPPPHLGELEFEVQENMSRVYHSHKEDFQQDQPARIIQSKENTTWLLSQPLALSSDIKVTFNERQVAGKNKDVLHFWFNTSFIEGDTLRLTKTEIDNAVKDKHHKIFSKDFTVELIFADVSFEPQDIEKLSNRATSLRVQQMKDDGKKPGFFKRLSMRAGKKKEEKKEEKGKGKEKGKKEEKVEEKVEEKKEEKGKGKEKKEEKVEEKVEEKKEEKVEEKVEEKKEEKGNGKKEKKEEKVEEKKEEEKKEEK